MCTCFYCRSTEGAVAGGGVVPAGVQHRDVHGRRADRAAAEVDLPSAQPLLHPRRHQVVTARPPHRRRHRAMLRQRLGRHPPRQDQVGRRQVGCLKTSGPICKISYDSLTIILR